MSDLLLFTLKIKADKIGLSNNKIKRRKKIKPK